MSQLVPQFISTDSETIVAEIVADYELKSGKTLQPGQPEMLLINAFAYREKILREQMQSAGLQMLLNYSSAPALDYLVELLGIKRLSASPATCTIQFTLSAGHGGVVIPANTRISTSDGQVFFSIQENVTVDAGVTTTTASAFASVDGVSGNGYAIGIVQNILDPWPFVESATNTTATSGGANIESDDELRERAKLAPGQFSVAGPVNAYKYFAKTASPDIIDVAVVSPTPGTVNVYPLVSGAIVTPPSILTLVNTVLNDDSVRPLTDTVVVLSPTITGVVLELEILTYTDADPVEVVATITSALENFKAIKAAQLGGDVKVDHLTALAVYDNTKVFDVTVVAPAADVSIADTEIANITSILVTITGTSNG